MSSFENKKCDIGVLGTGTWGIALCRLLANKGHRVTAWSAIAEEVDILTEKHTHPNLPGMEVPESIAFTKNMEDAVLEKELILFAVPSVFIRSTAKSVSDLLRGKSGDEGKSDVYPIIVTVAKGVEKETLMTMSQVIHDQMQIEGLKVVALSGPTHAEEVAFDQPTAIVSACEDMDAAEAVQDIFMTSKLRVYTNPDIDGVELCGAMKNVIALTVGISKGLGFGDNAKAALITRGMEEIHRLGTAMGCEERTFSGLAGIGDLIVTATSEHSRNNRCGQLIGQGRSPEEAVKEVGMVVEGLNALPSIMELSKKYNIEVPISQTMDRIVSEGMDPKKATAILMGRERKSEF